jgi:hypothetical protein
VWWTLCVVVFIAAYFDFTLIYQAILLLSFLIYMPFVIYAVVRAFGLFMKGGTCFLLTLRAGGEEIVIPSTDIILPYALTRWKSELYTLGFDDFGTYAGENSAAQYFFSRVFSDKSQTVFAEIIFGEWGHSIVKFETRFADSYQLYMSQNPSIHIPIDSELRSLEKFQPTLSETYDYHLHQIEIQKSTHGQPQPIQAIQDYINNSEPLLDFHKSLHRIFMLQYFRQGGGFCLYILPMLVYIGLFSITTLPETINLAIELLLIGLVFWFVDIVSLLKPEYSKSQSKKRKMA